MEQIVASETLRTSQAGDNGGSENQEFSWVDQEDARKLHSEINQLSHQRFLLTTLAITGFVTANAALFSRTSSQDGTGLAVVFSTIIEVFLFLLGRLSDVVRYISRCEATYLIANKATHWEQPWREFRRTHRYAGFAGAQIGVFMSLMAVQALIPTMLAIVFEWPKRLWLALPWVVTVVLIILIFIFRGTHDRKEIEASKLWRELLAQTGQERGRRSTDAKARANTGSGVTQC